LRIDILRYKGHFYAYSTIPEVLPYFKDHWGSILLAVSDLVKTPYWLEGRAETAETEVTSTPAALPAADSTASLSDSAPTAPVASTTDVLNETTALQDIRVLVLHLFYIVCLRACMRACECSLQQ
jgi:hypothetical protein